MLVGGRQGRTAPRAIRGHDTRLLCQREETRATQKNRRGQRAKGMIVQL